MKKSVNLLVIINCAIVISGCTSALAPGAEKVLLTTQPVLDNCHYVGQVSARDINGATQMYTSHQHLQMDQMNHLKNQALTLGANLVVVTDHQTTYVKARHIEKRVDTHAMTGNAYICPANTLNKIAQRSTENLSDIKD